MTGFGRGEVADDQLNLVFELSSVNSRYFDFKARLPSFLKQFESKAIKLVQQECIRGRMTLKINYNFLNGSDHIPVLDKEKLEQYKKLLEEIQDQLNTSDQLHVEKYIDLPDVIKQQSVMDENSFEELFFNGIKIALEEIKKMRKIEGDFLCQDVGKRLVQVELSIQKIENLTAGNTAKWMEKYRDRINELLKDHKFDENRIIQEAAVISEKKDITEEVIRMKSHIKLFKLYIEDDRCQGRKMNFLLQEMTREVNTIGAKTDLIEVSHLVVEVKDELEKIREQVQNVL